MREVYTDGDVLGKNQPMKRRGDRASERAGRWPDNKYDVDAPESSADLPPFHSITDER